MVDLCTACLCVGRNLYFIEETGFYHLYSQILNEIPVYDISQLCVRVCWECRSLLRRFHLFKLQVKRSYTDLMQNARQNTSQQSLARPSHLTIEQQYELSNIVHQPNEVKKEIIESDDYIYEVKSEAVEPETHCEPETFANYLDKPKRKKDASVKKDKLQKEKTKKVKVKPMKEKTKKKIKVKKKRVTTLDESAKDISDGASDRESILDVCNGDNEVEERLRSKENELTQHEGEISEDGKKVNGAVRDDRVRPAARPLAEPRAEPLAERPQCVECGKIFSSRKTYRYHLNVLHKGQNRYPCPRCGKVYQWKSNLGRHMRSHKALDSGELYCEMCDKRFASVATYRQHLRVSRRHVSESEFSFMCNECGKKFVNKTRLRDHIDWEHLKKIKFRCQLCNKPFKCHTSLYVHMQNVHRNKEKKDNLCHVCGKSYQNAAKLKYHIVAMHTSETPYQCQQCSAAFGWYSSLYRHVREVHYKMKVQPKKAKKSKKLGHEVLPSLMPPQHVLQTIHQPGPP